MFERYIDKIVDEQAANAGSVDDAFSLDLQRVLRSVRRTPIAVGEIVRDGPASRDRGRGQLVRRSRYNRSQNRLLVSHDLQGRVFAEIYGPDMRRIVPRTLVGQLRPGAASTENNVRSLVNKIFHTNFVHATQRRGTSDRHGRGPDMVPKRFDEFESPDAFSWPSLPCIFDPRCYKGTDPETGNSRCFNRSCPGRCRFGLIGECCCDE